MKGNDIIVNLRFAFVLDHFGEHLGAIETEEVDCESLVLLQRSVFDCLVLRGID